MVERWVLYLLMLVARNAGNKQKDQYREAGLQTKLG